MPLNTDTPMPSLAGATAWFNGQPDLSGLSPVRSGGRAVTVSVTGVTLIHFWSVSCGICTEQMPVLNRWRTTYETRGLRLIGVHKPRSERDTDLGRVEETVRDYGLQHPVAVDNTHALVDLFHNEGVPEFFLYDAELMLRLNLVGDQGLDKLEKMILLLTRAALLQTQEP